MRSPPNLCGSSTPTVCERRSRGTVPPVAIRRSNSRGFPWTLATKPATRYKLFFGTLARHPHFPLANRTPTVYYKCRLYSAIMLRKVRELQVAPRRRRAAILGAGGCGRFPPAMYRGVNCRWPIRAPGRPPLHCIPPPDGRLSCPRKYLLIFPPFYFMIRAFGVMPEQKDRRRLVR